MKADLPLAKTSSSKFSLVSSVVASEVAPMRKSAIASLLPRVLQAVAGLAKSLHIYLLVCKQLLFKVGLKSALQSH